ncbi:lysophospholipid transporter LplT [Thiohalomonas denitrificans]|uniref:MFS transporter, LPLT family, lysophospholipid transporter n=1 Tax=Thiohalomonas denitrificans TaxID=415747 RepID=A0A1G5QSL5_9GAMM|nr:lysophospholipid transporter LplT [Thiohalomonas denitrificans]SCZ64874.1 MFS transporter, LPLT family, lysophospholipid transporter [Thiohalomonas denitrificans]
MTRAVFSLLIAQFLTAFADNAILFIAIATVIQAAEVGEWYKPALQASFLVAFVLLAPWVGRLADKRPKAEVLMVGNVLKAIGALMMLAGIEPLLSYAVVGIGAAIYSPGKYGILPELVHHDHLVKANGWVEGSTIVAIILGAVIGGHLADISIPAALGMVTCCYIASLIATRFIPRIAPHREVTGSAVAHFGRTLRQFMHGSRARFAMLGASVFWGASVVLRVMLTVWAPAVLMMTATGDIANLAVYIALGIAAGSLLAHKLIPLDFVRRARFAGYLMGAGAMALAVTSDPMLAKAALVFCGVMGGIFVVPVNAALQEIGHHTVGAGGAVAIQNFFENLAMLVATAVYTGLLIFDLDPVIMMAGLGALIMIATLAISVRLPSDPEPRPVSAIEEPLAQKTE